MEDDNCALCGKRDDAGLDEVWLREERAYRKLCDACLTKHLGEKLGTVLPS